MNYYFNVALIVWQVQSSMLPITAFAGHLPHLWPLELLLQLHPKFYFSNSLAWPNHNLGAKLYSCIEKV